MNQQLQNFQTTLSQITGMQGNNETAAMNFLSKCLFTIGIGSNDIGVNYYGPLPLSSIEYTPDQFTALLIDQYSQQLRVSATILTIFLIIFCTRNNSLEKLSYLFSLAFLMLDIVPIWSAKASPLWSVTNRLHPGFSGMVRCKSWLYMCGLHK